MYCFQSVKGRWLTSCECPSVSLHSLPAPVAVEAMRCSCQSLACYARSWGQTNAPHHKSAPLAQAVHPANMGTSKTDRLFMPSIFYLQTKMHCLWLPAHCFTPSHPHIPEDLNQLPDVRPQFVSAERIHDAVDRHGAPEPATCVSASPHLQKQGCVNVKPPPNQTWQPTIPLKLNVGSNDPPHTFCSSIIIAGIRSLLFCSSAKIVCGVLMNILLLPYCTSCEKPLLSTMTLTPSRSEPRRKLGQVCGQIILYLKNVQGMIQKSDLAKDVLVTLRGDAGNFHLCPTLEGSECSASCRQSRLFWHARSLAGPGTWPGGSSVRHWRALGTSPHLVWCNARNRVPAK